MSNPEVERNFQIIQRKQQKLHHLEQQAGEGKVLETDFLRNIDNLKKEIAELEGRISFITSHDEQLDKLDVKPLPSPLARYDSFCKTLFEIESAWPLDNRLFKQQVLSLLRQAARAENVLILHHSGAGWELRFAAEDAMSQPLQEITGLNLELSKFLYQSELYFKEAKPPHSYLHTNIVFSKIPPGDKSCVFIGLPNSNPLQILIFYGINLGFELDSTFSTIMNALLRGTDNLSIPKHPASIEIYIYNALKAQLGYVSDYMYERQYALFKKRLSRMTVAFEPIITLSEVPYIGRWEALARDSETKLAQAPVDLFETAELWGKQFQIELDIHFLLTAVEKYGKIPPGIYKNQREQIARREELAPLHINVYPASLTSRAYKETIEQIKKIFPLTKLVLEISEKVPIPLPDAKHFHDNEIRWFREQLSYYSDQGISFAIDDFGVGYASTSRLSRLEPEFIKIDRDALLHYLGGFTLDYARNLVKESIGKMKIIVEGFDDQSKFTLAQLYKLNILYVQGHLLSKARDSIFRLTQEDTKRIAALLKA